VRKSAHLRSIFVENLSTLGEHEGDEGAVLLRHDLDVVKESAFDVLAQFLSGGAGVKASDVYSPRNRPAVAPARSGTINGRVSRLEERKTRVIRLFIRDKEERGRAIT